MFKRFINDESGQGMTEYILIVALVAIAAIVVVRVFGEKIQELFTKSTKKISDNADQAVQ